MTKKRSYSHPATILVKALNKIVESDDSDKTASEVETMVEDVKTQINFAAKLYMLLADSERAGHDHIISWNPGKYISFCSYCLSTNVFTNTPLLLADGTAFKVFNRQGLVGLLHK